MEVIRYNDGSGYRHGLLVAEGRKYLQLLLIDTPVRVRKVKLDEARYIQQITSTTVSKAKAIMRTFVRRQYGTMRNAPKTVREILR